MNEGSDWLDQRLREEASYIDDDGFTARVMSRLPARGRPPQALRASILLLVSAFATAIAYHLTDSGRFVWVALAYLEMVPFWAVLGAILFIGLVISGYALTNAMANERKPHTFFR